MPTIADAWALLDQQHIAKFGTPAPRGEIQYEQARNWLRSQGVPESEVVATALRPGHDAPYRPAFARFLEGFGVTSTEAVERAQAAYADERTGGVIGTIAAVGSALGKTAAVAAAGAVTYGIGSAVLKREFAQPPAQLVAPPTQYELVEQASMFNGDGWDWQGLLQGATRAALDYRASRAQAVHVAQGPQAMPGGAMTQNIAWPSLPAVIGGARTALGLGAGAVVAGATAAGRWVMTSIGRISKRKVWAMTKHIGSVAATAAALGISEALVAQIAVEESGRKRRGGGITGAQMRTTRRTIGKVERLHRQIVSACSSARVPARGRRNCPPPKVIVAKGR